MVVDTTHPDPHRRSSLLPHQQMIQQLPFNEVRDAFENHVREHGATPTINQLAEILRMERTKVGYTLKELQDSGQCLVTDRATREQESHKKAVLAYNQKRRCVGCGTGMDNRTAGCASCMKRHEARRNRGLVFLSEPKLEPGRCKGCHRLYDEHTIGCKACWTRHEKRKAASLDRTREAV